MKCSLAISNFLEEISSFSRSIIFLYFFALITEEVFLISPCYSLELCIQMGISFLFSFCPSFPFFSQLFIRPLQTAILPFAFLFLGDSFDHCHVQCCGFPDSSVCKRIFLQCRRSQFNSWVGKIPWRSERLPTPVF